MSEEKLDLLAELQAMEAELARLESFQRDNKIVTFKPIGNQQKFFESRAPVRLLFGSNRSGKSVCSTAEEIACAYGYRPWLREDDPNRIVRMADGEPIPVPNVGFHLLENLKVAGTQVFIPKMEEWLPKGAAKIRKNNQGQPLRVEYANGSVLHVLSQEQSTSSLEGASGHYVVSDEPPAREKWIALTRGLIDTSGIAWIAGTPIKASYFMAELMNESLHSDEVDLISISIDDNRVSKGGYLKDKAVDRFIDSLRPEEIQARLHGKPQHLAGAVFPTWKPQPPYFIEPFDIPPWWPRIMGVDPAGRKPMAAVWIAISPDNIWYVYRDLYDASLRTVKQVSDTIKHMEGWRKTPTGQYMRGGDAEPVVLRIIDTSGNVHEKSSGHTVTSTFAQNDLFFMNAYKIGYMASIDSIQEMLRMDGEYEWDDGPRFVVFNTCSRMSHEFMNFIWQPESSQGRSAGADPAEKPLKSNDDCLDVSRYLVMSKATHNGLRRLMDEMMGE